MDMKNSFGLKTKLNSPFVFVCISFIRNFFIALKVKFLCELSLKSNIYEIGNFAPEKLFGCLIFEVVTLGVSRKSYFGDLASPLRYIFERLMLEFTYCTPYIFGADVPTDAFCVRVGKKFRVSLSKYLLKRLNSQLNDIFIILC